MAITWENVYLNWTIQLDKSGYLNPFSEFYRVHQRDDFPALWSKTFSVVNKTVWLVSVVKLFSLNFKAL